MLEPKLRHGLIFFLCVAIVLLARQPISAAEPAFQDKTVAEWLERLTSHDGAERKAAVKAITADPENATPVLEVFVSLLNDQDSLRRVLSRWALSEVGFAAIPALLSGRASIDAERRRAASQAIQASGESAEQVAAELVRLLPKLNDDRQDWALIAIDDLGRIAVPALVQATSYHGRREWHVREVAVRFLRSHVSESKLVVQTLIERLQDASPSVRSDAAQSLSSALPSEHPAVARALRALVLRDSESRVREAALSSLKELAFPHFTEKLSEFQMLRTLGDLRDKDMKIVRRALFEVAKMGPAAAHATTILKPMLSDADFAARSLTAATLTAISHQGDSLQIIVDGLKNGEVLHPDVIELLVESGPVAVPVLVAANRYDPIAFSTTQLMSEISRIEIQPSDQARLRDLLYQEPPAVRAWAVQKLIDLDDKSQPTIAALAERMGDPDRSIRDHAVMKLMDMGQPAIPGLLDAMRHRNHVVRQKSAYVITVIGQPSNTAVDALVRALDDDDETVRFWACVALGRVKDQQMRLAPLLTARQTDASEKVRGAARNAFQQLTLTDADR